MNLDQAIAAASEWNTLRWVVTVLVVACVALVVWTLVEARTLTVRHAVLSSPTLPEAFDGTRVVFAADIHAGPYMSRARIRSLVDSINALEPDIVILGGDYVGGRSSGKRLFYPEIRRLNARLGIYAVLGNHDYWEGLEQAKLGLEAADITLLVNGSTVVTRGADSIRIAGVDDAWAGTADIAQANAGISREEFAILVSHAPDFFPGALPAVRGTFDLALAGHTHGGQLTVFGMHAPLMPSIYGQRFQGGWTEESGVPVLVTRGVGNVTLPIRFFAPPEMHVIELRRGPRGVEKQ